MSSKVIFVTMPVAQSCDDVVQRQGHFEKYRCPCRYVVLAISSHHLVGSHAAPHKRDDGHCGSHSQDYPFGKDDRIGHSSSLQQSVKTEERKVDTIKELHGGVSFESAPEV